MTTISKTILNSCNESNHNTRHITDVLKGKRNSAKGYTFEYQKEVI